MNRKEPAKTERSDLIAIVDDDVSARHALEFLLKVLGHRTAGYGSAAQFLATDLAAYVCLILDHHMPEITGVELAEKLRSDRNPIPIMLISGDLTPEVADKAASVGIDLISDKPPEHSALTRFIEDALARPH